MLPFAFTSALKFVASMGWPMRALASEISVPFTTPFAFMSPVSAHWDNHVANSIHTVKRDVNCLRVGDIGQRNSDSVAADAHHSTIADSSTSNRSPFPRLPAPAGYR